MRIILSVLRFLLFALYLPGFLFVVFVNSFHWLAATPKHSVWTSEGRWEIRCAWVDVWHWTIGEADIDFLKESDGRYTIGLGFALAIGLVVGISIVLAVKMWT